MEVERVPKATFSRIIFYEARRLGQMQVSETLIDNYDSFDRTLHTDRTSKFGQHYGTGQDRVVGVREMSCGGTATQLGILKDILSELNESFGEANSTIGNKLIASVKNVMSDRHTVQKKLILFCKITVLMFYQMLLMDGLI